MLAADTWYALRARAGLDTANELVWEKDYRDPSRFGDTYNVVQNSLVLTVALGVARLFDVSDPDRYPIEQQDKASMPVLANLLMRRDIQDALAEKARDWHSQHLDGAELGETSCRRAISTAIALYETFSKSDEHRDALSRVRDFRTSRLAHNLFDDHPADLPRFDDLDLLANSARDFVRLVVLAVEGIDRDLGREEGLKRDVDRQFWDVALSALFAAEGEAPR
ncbi:hypothetical protein [Bradyrhizobium lablabi]|uniref:AbiU2 domain-containing protein n=1 Tax=Bradyrhizobium lablabi TaxID=722472 RepID=UPI0012AC485A|nr:hypothetical protein [Bradyrhizobium lablabi]